MQKLACDLDSCFLCRHCMAEWKEVTAAYKRTLLIKKGKTLFKERDQVMGIFFIYSGVVKIHAPWTDGREMIIRFARGGEIAGHRGLGGNAIYPVSATALEDTVACFVTNEFLELSMKANPSLTYTLMNFYSTELQKAEKRLRDINHMEVKGRIAGALLDILQTFGKDEDQFLALKLTRQDIAAYAGTTYETVFKFFVELAAAGIITTSGKNIHVDRLEKLIQLAGR